MFVLLPPSEAKMRGGRGRRFGERLDAAAGPIGEGRRVTAAALLELTAGNPHRAAEALLLPAGVADDALAANAALRASRTMPALDRYSGVVYDGLAVAGMDAATRRVAGRRVLVFSGLLGVVRGDEPVPDYRVPAKAVLPGVGIAGTFWRPRLTEALPAVIGKAMVVDLRSGDYAAMWRSPAERTVAVRVLSPAPRGGHAVISHTSKLTKGRLAAALLRAAAAGAPARDADDVAEAWLSSGGAEARPGPGNQLDLYTRTSTG